MKVKLHFLEAVLNLQIWCLLSAHDGKLGANRRKTKRVLEYGGWLRQLRKVIEVEKEGGRRHYVWRERELSVTDSD